MSISVFTYITTLLIAIVVICGLNVWMKRSLHEVNYFPGLLLVILLLPFIRLFIPIELFFTCEVEMDVIYPEIYNFFKGSSLHVGIYALSFAWMLICIWLAGALLTFFFEVRKYRAIIRCFRHLSPLQNTEANILLGHLLIGHNRRSDRVKLIQTSCVEEPMVYGLWQPVIVLPQRCFSDSELHVIMSHEVGHYVHGDLIIKWILEMICSLYWWLPPIYALKKQIYYVMEIRADRMVVGKQPKQKRIEYMDTLLKICRDKRHSAYDPPMAASLFTYGDMPAMKRRFQAILHMDVDDKRIRQKTFVLMTVACFLLMFSFCFVLQPYYSTPSDDSDSFSITTDDFYLLLIEDGHYELHRSDGVYIASIKEIKDDLCALTIYEK